MNYNFTMTLFDSWRVQPSILHTDSSLHNLLGQEGIINIMVILKRIHLASILFTWTDPHNWLMLWVQNHVFWLYLHARRKWKVHCNFFQDNFFFIKHLAPENFLLQKVMASVFQECFVSFQCGEKKNKRLFFAANKLYKFNFQSWDVGQWNIDNQVAEKTFNFKKPECQWINYHFRFHNDATVQQ